MAPRYEICAGLEKGHKSTKNTLKSSVALGGANVFCCWAEDGPVGEGLDEDGPVGEGLDGRLNVLFPVSGELLFEQLEEMEEEEEEEDSKMAFLSANLPLLHIGLGLSLL